MRRALFLVLALSAYGSLYPFEFSVPDGSLNAQWSTGQGRVSLTDIAQNILLFLPVGLLGVLGYRSNRAPMLRVAALIVFSAVFAYVLQVAQLFIAERTPAMSDVWWNTLGATIGAVSAFPLRRTAITKHDSPVHARSILILVALWFAGETAPFVPSLDIDTLKASLKPLMLENRWDTVAAIESFARVLAIAFVLRCICSYERTLLFVIALAGLSLIAKLLVISQHLDVSNVAGTIGGVCAFASLGTLSFPVARYLVCATLVASYTLSSLFPFELSQTTGNFEWIPFASLLEGSAINAIGSLTPRLFVFATLLFLFGTSCARVVALFLWLLMLEVAQVFIVGRVASTTEPASLLLIAWFMARADSLKVGGYSVPAAVLNQGSPSNSNTRITIKRGLLHTFVPTAILATGIYVVVRLPGIPYNVRELLLFDSHALVCLLFALAVLWTGMGPALLSRRMQDTHWPLLTLPLWTFALCVVGIGLFYSSATSESVRDITGSNNLYWYVTNRDTWGAVGREAFLLLPDSSFVDFFEKLVRYAALFGPLFIFLAICDLICRESKTGRKSVLPVTLAALPWLWLCKGIAFDWSSTDNLNELIARPGQFAIGGGGYLYCLLIVGSFCCAYAATARGLKVVWAVCLVCLAVPVSWWLLNNGLEANVHKYGNVFSGAQFLLGPDRSNLLTEEILFGRWALVFVAGTLTVSLGMRAMAAFLLTTENSDVSNLRSRSGLTIDVPISDRTRSLLRAMSEVDGRDIPLLIENIVSVQLESHDNDILVQHATTHSADESSEPKEQVQIGVKLYQMERIVLLAERTNVSRQRFLGAVVSDFFAQLSTTDRTPPPLAQ